MSQKMNPSPKKKSLKVKKELLAAALPLLKQDYPKATIALRYSNALELLIATMLSAQCTDERVNKVTESLFVKYTSPADYCAVPQEELEKDIFSTGYYKSKAKNIQGCCRQLLDHHGGEIPGTLEELTELPGVGRKTANVVLGHWFGVPGMVVDTHVTRITNLLGLTTSTNAVVIERELCKLLPEEEWVSFTHLMIEHGRAVCIARRPRCGECSLSHICPSAKEATG